MIILAGYLAWRFSFLIVYILIAAVTSFIGQPLVSFFDRLKIRRFHLPHSFNVILTLIILLVGFMSLFAIFVPLIVKQAQTIAMIDINEVSSRLRDPLAWLENELHLLGFLPSGSTLQTFLTENTRNLLSITNISEVLNNVFSFAGSFIIGLFSIIFIAFFFLKDESMFESIILAIIPLKHHKAVKQILVDSEKLLKRYFIGLLAELFCVMSLITIGLWIFGVKNALLLGFFGGLMNVIPYLGPVLGTLLALLLGASTTLAVADFSDVLPVLLRIGGVFLVVNYIDNIFLQPMIYSSSVKAHPLEIFFIIIIGGSLGGILGMLVAVPVYTVLRVIAREYFSNFRAIRELTEDL
jgi:predicted PurR-regulated permease PerM